MSRSYVRLVSLALLLSIALPHVVTVCSPYFPLLVHRPGFYHKAAIFLLASMVTCAGAIEGLRAFSLRLDKSFREQALHLDGINASRLDVAIVLSAAVSLHLELSVIRWQAEVLPLFALYKNYSLLACFAGLGLGYALSRRESIPLPMTIPALTFQIALLQTIRYGMGFLHHSSITRTPFVEQLNMGVPVGTTAPYLVASYSLLATVFLLTALAFIPVGQLCGRLMSRQGNTLRAYGLNLLGSMMGIVSVSCLSWIWAPPVIWFSLAFPLLLAFLGYQPRSLLLNGSTALICAAVLAWPVTPGIERLHSPYQLIERGVGQRGLTGITAAGHYYQRVHDLSVTNSNREADSLLHGVGIYYDLPYRVGRQTPDRVAIVGSGMGNDVAAALRAGAQHVDAVEIDPAILHLGKLYHPEQPYHDPRVKAIIADARTHFRRTEQTYDIIVYGLLDSHALLSHASSLRLDSYVYTVEGLREARSRLRENGILSLSFYVMNDLIGRKIFLMMEEAFGGHPPVCIRTNPDGFVVYVQARDGALSVDSAVLHEMGLADVTAKYANKSLLADVSTDDWPFLYMPRRVYPTSYLGMLGLFLLLSTALIRSFSQGHPSRENVGFFLLGAGFMLLETKAITELGLVYGNTWQVISVVIAGVLCMAFAANMLVSRLHPRPSVLWFVPLLATLGAGFAVSLWGGLSSTAVGKTATLVLLTGPLLFSGIVFSTHLARVASVSAAMGANLIGAMTGGVLEYNSMCFGFRFLYVLAALIYILAVVAFSSRSATRRRRVPRET